MESLINPTLLDDMTKDFALHRLTPLVGWKRLSEVELYFRLWDRWLWN